MSTRRAAGPPPLPRAFFERELLVVARELVGCRLVRRDGDALLVGRLVEVEAYGGLATDPSAHSYRGETPRCRAMFGPAGHAYVYTTHQGRACLNVAAVGDAVGKAVLLRALEPLAGAERMRAHRVAALAPGPTRARLEQGRDGHALASGPARLCLALGVDRALDGIDLTDARGALYLATAEDTVRAEPDGRGRAAPARNAKGPTVVWTERVGLNPNSASRAWCWRAHVAGSRSVSGPASARLAARAATRPVPPRCPAPSDVSGRR